MEFLATSVAQYWKSNLMDYGIQPLTLRASARSIPIPEMCDQFQELSGVFLLQNYSDIQPFVIQAQPIL